jgi:hypothetical protein
VDSDDPALLVFAEDVAFNSPGAAWTPPGQSLAFERLLGPAAGVPATGE